MTERGQVASFSAPGKLMLFGEYAVLEGYPSLAMCLDRRIRATARVLPGEPRVVVDAPAVLAQPFRGGPELRAWQPAADHPLALLAPLLRDALADNFNKIPVAVLDGIAVIVDLNAP